MTLTVTPQPGNAPPRNQITIATPDGSAMTAVSLNRTANGTTTPVRVQPAPGPSPITAFDYEVPKGTNVVYTATVTHGTTTETYTASGVTLTPTAAWATHPTTPALSLCLDTGSFAQMGIASIGAVTRAALTTKHRIIGSEFQVVTKVGPRAAATLQMQVTTTTLNELAAVQALVRDQTPLLIEIPAAWGWGWEDGYYDVADYTADRVLQYGPEPRRTVTLTLERVTAPAGTQQSPRTWASLLSGFPTWGAVSAAYATWTDELTDSRR